MARFNRNRNPSFDNNTDGWTSTRTRAAPRRVPNYARPDGVRGCFADASSSGTGNAIIQNTAAAVAEVVPGRTYTLSIYVYQGSGTTKNVRVDADQYTASQGYVSTWGDTGPTVAVPHQTWTRITQTGTVSDGIALLATYVLFDTRQDGVYLGVCCAMVEDGPTSPNYRDGNSRGWTWTGTPGNSQSQDLDPTARAGVAYIDPSQPVAPGEQITLTSEGSGNPEGGQVTNVWSVLDAGGTGLTDGDIDGRTLAFASFTAPSRPGTITVRLTVTDDNGNTGTDTVSVTVASTGPEPGRLLLSG